MRSFTRWFWGVLFLRHPQSRGHNAMHAGEATASVAVRLKVTAGLTGRVVWPGILAPCEGVNRRLVPTEQTYSWLWIWAPPAGPAAQASWGVGNPAPAGFGRPDSWRTTHPPPWAWVPRARSPLVPGARPPGGPGGSWHPAVFRTHPLLLCLRRLLGLLWAARVFINSPPLRICLEMVPDTTISYKPDFLGYERVRRIDA